MGLWVEGVGTCSDLKARARVWGLRLSRRGLEFRESFGLAVEAHSVSHQGATVGFHCSQGSSVFRKPKKTDMSDTP